MLDLDMNRLGYAERRAIIEARTTLRIVDAALEPLQHLHERSHDVWRMKNHKRLADSA